MKIPSGSLTALIAGALVLVGTQLQAATILTGAAKIEGNATPIQLASGGFVENAVAYSDRTHTLVNIPDELEGDDLVQVSNSDKTSVPYQVDVTFGRLAALYVALDDRYAQPYPWMNDPSFTGLPTIFFNTGVKMGIDENADGSVNNSFTLWATIAPPGTYHLGENNHEGNNYVIFGNNKLIPEPSSLALCGLGLLSLVRAGRRRQV